MVFYYSICGVFIEIDVRQQKGNFRRPEARARAGRKKGDRARSMSAGYERGAEDEGDPGRRQQGARKHGGCRDDQLGLVGGQGDPPQQGTDALP